EIIRRLVLAVDLGVARKRHRSPHQLHCSRELVPAWDRSRRSSRRRDGGALDEGRHGSTPISILMPNRYRPGRPAKIRILSLRQFREVQVALRHIPIRGPADVPPKPTVLRGPTGESTSKPRNSCRKGNVPRTFAATHKN